MTSQALFFPLEWPLTSKDGAVSSEAWRRWLQAINDRIQDGVAPGAAQYIVQEADLATLPNAQSLGALSSGYLRNDVTGTVGTLSITVDGSDWQNLDAAQLVGVIPNGAVPNPLPAVSGANLTALTAPNLVGVIPNGAVPNPLPAVSGAALTALNASELASGQIPDARLPPYGVFRPVFITNADTPYSITVANGVVLCVASGGVISVLMPNVAAFINRVFAVKKIDASANIVTVDGNGANIDGAATKALAAQWNSLLMVSDGAAWNILASV